MPEPPSRLLGPRRASDGADRPLPYVPRLASRARGLTRALTAWIACAVAPMALAEPPPPDGAPVDLRRLHIPISDTVLFALPGNLEGRYGYVAPLEIQAEDEAAPDALPGEHRLFGRLRLRPSILLTSNAWPVFQAYQAEVDVELPYAFEVATAPEWLRYDPETSRRGGDPEPWLRQAHLLMAGERLAVQAGLMTSSWGTGALANAGDDPQPGVRRSPFGYRRRGDRVIRLGLAFFPLDAPQTRPGEAPADPPLTIALAGDVVLDDDLSSWWNGDRAYQGIAAVIGRYEGLEIGAYGVYRHEDHGEGGTTELVALDAQVRYDHEILRGLSVYGEGEVAGFMGKSSFSQSVLKEGPYGLGAIGGIARLGLSWEFLGGGAGTWPGALEVAFELGGGTGDTNPFDAALSSFTFDREHRVGLLMFREQLRRTTAVTAYNLADETYRAEPSRGFDSVATDGAVRAALYINPRVGLVVAEGLRLDLGFLWAQSSGDFVDAYQTALAGGVPTGPRGAQGASGLGIELDVGLRYDRHLGPVGLTLRAELGWLQPGEVFDTAAGDAAADVLGAWVHAEVWF